MDEIDKRVGRPKFPLQLGGHDLARVLQQPRKNLKKAALGAGPAIRVCEVRLREDPPRKHQNGAVQNPEGLLTSTDSSQMNASLPP